MKYKYISLIFLCVLGVACSDVQNVEPQTSEVNQTSDQKIVKVEVAQDPLNGTYLFDAEKYKTEQLKHEDSIFKKMKPQDLERMMSVFRPFKIEVEGQKAIASFSHEVIVGTLQKLSNGKQTRLEMVPDDETKKDQSVTLIIEGDNMILDPGRKETDKMFFQRSSQE